MLRHLAADKGATCLAAALADATHDLGHFLGFQFADRNVIKEEQRLGAGGQNVVRAHGDQIDADGIVLARKLRNLELGSHAVGSGHQKRIFHLLSCGNREQTAKTADIANNFLTIRRMNRLLDGVYRTSTFFNVNAGLRIRDLCSGLFVCHDLS